MAISSNESFSGASGSDPLAHFAHLAQEALLAEEGAEEFTFGQGRQFAMPRHEAAAALSKLAERLQAPRHSSAFQTEVETVSVQEAANFLMVSEEFMEDLLNTGEVPFYQKGQERRIPFGLLSDYDRKVRQGQEDAINFISQEFKEMGLHEYFERA